MVWRRRSFRRFSERPRRYENRREIVVINGEVYVTYPDQMDPAPAQAPIQAQIQAPIQQVAAATAVAAAVAVEVSTPRSTQEHLEQKRKIGILASTEDEEQEQTTQSRKKPRPTSAGTSDATAARVVITSSSSSSSGVDAPSSALSETASTDNSVKVVIRGVRPSTPIQSNVSVKETSSSSKIKLQIKSKPRQAQADNESSANINTAMEDSELFCTILRNDKVTTLHHISTTDRDIITEIISSPETLNIGFITFPNSSCTFANARKVMKKELDVEGERDGNDSDSDSDSDNEEKDETDCLPKKFKFYVPHLGKISKKQETKIGPMLAFLQKTSGDGSQRNPLKIIVYDSKKRY